MLRISGYFFVGIEVRRLLNPRLNLLAVEAGVPDLFRLGQIELAEQRSVEIGDLPLGAVLIEHEQLVDHGWRRDVHHHDLAVVGSRELLHRLIAARQLLHLPAGGIDADQNRSALLGHDIEQVRSVFRPHRGKAARSTRRAVVAAHAAVDVIVVIGSEVLRDRSGLQLERPQVGLGVGAHRLLHRADKRDALAVRREHHVADAAQQSAQLHLG